MLTAWTRGTSLPNWKEKAVEKAVGKAVGSMEQASSQVATAANVGGNAADGKATYHTLVHPYSGIT